MQQVLDENREDNIIEEISTREVDNALKQMTNDKSAGPRHIPIEFGDMGKCLTGNTGTTYEQVLDGRGEYPGRLESRIPWLHS